MTYKLEAQVIEVVVPLHSGGRILTMNDELVARQPPRWPWPTGWVLA